MTWSLKLMMVENRIWVVFSRKQHNDVLAKVLIGGSPRDVGIFPIIFGGAEQANRDGYAPGSALVTPRGVQQSARNAAPAGITNQRCCNRNSNDTFKQ